MISIEEMLQPVTTEQQFEKFIATLEAIGVPARSWRDGGTHKTILRLVAGAYAGFSQAVLGFVRAGFLETATGGWLTMLAYYVYGVTRLEATFAVGKLRLSNTGGGVFTIDAFELRAISLVSGKAYTNLAGFTLNPGNVLEVDIRAVEVGASSSAPAATIGKLETPLPGVVVTNLAAVVGSDAEKDPDLRVRSKNRLAVISGKGPRGAYAYAVRSAVRPDGSAVDINRLRVSPSSSTGIVTVHVASPAGAPLDTDLPYVEASIETYARPDTVTVNLLAAAPVAYTRDLIVWARRVDGLTAPDLALLVSNALLEMTQAYPIGGIAKPPLVQGYLYADGIVGTAKSAHPAIFDVDGAGADIALAVGEVATLAATIDVRIVEVSS
jgi:uncharacterized phage protein gp47/JayE